jgi:uncharacterized membrane protein
VNRQAHLWAVGFGDTRRAAQVRDAVAELGRRTHDLVLLEMAVAVRYADGSFTLDGEPFLPEVGARGGTMARILASLALGAPPMTARAVGVMLTLVGVAPEGAIDDAFVRDVQRLMKPGTSALFALDEVRDMCAVLRGIEGLGGTVLKTNVDLERARRIQAVLAAPADSAGAAGDGSRSGRSPARERSNGP